MDEKSEAKVYTKKKNKRKKDYVDLPYVVVIVENAKLYKSMNFNGEYIEAKKGDKYPVTHRYRVEGKDHKFQPVVKYMFKTRDGFLFWKMKLTTLKSKNK